MQKNKPLDVIELFRETLGDKIGDFTLPPPSFAVMECEITAFSKETKTITVKMPVLESWLNPYGTMQGGFIVGAIDNAVGPLSMLIAPPNVTRDIESKLLIPILMDIEYIYITVTLFEHKKRRLIFDAVVKDKDETIYAKARLTNWIV